MKLKLTYPAVTLGANIFGILVSSFLWYSEITSNVVGCLTGGCMTVLLSEYSKIFDIPIAVLGIGFYAFGALLAFIRIYDMHPLPKLLSWAHGGFSIFGSIYFFYLEIVKIHAICSWCKFSTATTIFLLIMVIMEVRKAGGVSALLESIKALMHEGIKAPKL